MTPPSLSLSLCLYLCVSVRGERRRKKNASWSKQSVLMEHIHTHRVREREMQRETYGETWHTVSRGVGRLTGPITKHDSGRCWVAAAAAAAASRVTSQTSRQQPTTPHKCTDVCDLSPPAANSASNSCPRCFHFRVRYTTCLISTFLRI